MVISLFDLVFTELNFGLSTELSQKSEVISLRQNFGLSPKFPLGKKAQRKWSKYILRPKFS